MYKLTPVIRYELKLNVYPPIYLTHQQLIDIVASHKWTKRMEASGTPNKWETFMKEGYYIESYFPYEDETDQMAMIYFHPVNRQGVTSVHINYDDIEGFIEDCHKIINQGLTR